MFPYKTGTVRVTSAYGMRTLGGKTAVHSGLDLVGTDKRIVAVKNGVIDESTIIFDKNNINWQVGNFIRLKADTGEMIYYFHLATRMAHKGQRVTAGDVIGIEGSTGYSTGSHLHFEVRVNGKAINVADYLGIENKIGTVIDVEGYNMKKNIKNRNNPNDWAKEAVDWAVLNRIMVGDEHGNLMLDEPCTREQMTVFLYRLYNLSTKGSI